MESKFSLSCIQEPYTGLYYVKYLRPYYLRSVLISSPNLNTYPAKNSSYCWAKILYSIYLSPHACYMTRTSTPLWYRRENIRCTVQIMKLRIFLFSFHTSCHSWANILKVRDQSSGPYKTTVKIRNLHFTFRNIQFLNRIRIDKNLEPKYGKNSPYLLCIYIVLVT